MHAAGTIGVVSTRGFAGAMIRLATRSHWNHVVIADGLGGVIEAEPGGVRLAPEAEYDDQAWFDLEPLTNEQRAARIAAAMASLGTPYNWPAIVVFGLQTLGIRAAWLSSWAQRRRNVICSELAVDVTRPDAGGWFAGRMSVTVPPSLIAELGLRSEW